jgi:hypothetical protein
MPAAPRFLGSVPECQAGGRGVRKKGEESVKNSKVLQDWPSRSLKSLTQEIEDGHQEPKMANLVLASCRCPAISGAGRVTGILRRSFLG